ncbi:uncharacterized protein ACWYII_043144 isoform 2-T4 [Salvelinus alpinus]
MDVVEKSESLSKPSREFLFGLLFHTINWFREVVNAFCSQKEPEMKMKVVTRLQNITYLQTLLDRTLAEGTGNKRKAPAKNSAADSSQLEEGTEAEETQQRRRRFRRPAGQGSVLCPTVPSSGSWTWRCCSVACSPGSLLDSELHSKKSPKDIAVSSCCLPSALTWRTATITSRLCCLKTRGWWTPQVLM